MDRRVHILGAAGSGTTTLGQALAERLAVPHFDTDDYFWIKTPIPYTQKRPEAERVAMMQADLTRRPAWVLSGSLCDWGDPLIPLFTLVVFLWIPADLRLRRLEEREIARYGAAALAPGGWFHPNHVEFMAYAASYDEGGLEVRSRKLHDEWLARLPCPVLRIEHPSTIEDQINEMERALDATGGKHERTTQGNRMAA